jgi:hypothetical protein
VTIWPTHIAIDPNGQEQGLNDAEVVTVDSLGYIVTPS